MLFLFKKIIMYILVTVATQPWIPRVQCVRSITTRINIQNPKPPHFQKSKMLKVTAPFYKPKPAILSVCTKDIASRTKKEIVCGLEILLPSNPMKTLMSAGQPLRENFGQGIYELGGKF